MLNDTSIEGKVSNLRTKAVAWGLTGLLSFGMPSFLAAYTGTDSHLVQQENKTKEQEKKEKFIKMLKENLPGVNKARKLLGEEPYTLKEYLGKFGIELEEEKKPSNLEKKVNINQTSLNPPTIRVYDEYGNLFNEETITYELSINRDYHLLVPERGIVELVNPQERGEYEADMTFHHDDRKLGNATQKFEFGDGFKAYDTGDATVQLEDEDDVPASIRFKWRMVHTPPPPEDVYDVETEEDVSVPKQEPSEPEKPKEKPPKAPIENIYRMKVSLGSEDANFINEGAEDPAFRLFSSHYDFDASFKGKALVHVNFIYNSHTNTFNTRHEEKLRIINFRGGVLYAPLVPFTIGAEISSSKVTVSNTDINNPNIDPHISLEDHDKFYLAKLGLTNGFGNTAIGVLAVAGAHNQSKIRRDNYIPYSNFRILEQSDWNQVHGLEAFVDIGRGKDSDFSLFLGGRYLFHRPWSQMVEEDWTIKPPLVDAGLFEFDKLSHSLSAKALLAYQIKHPFSLVLEGNYTSYTMKFLDDYLEKHDGVGIRGGVMLKW